MGRIRENIEVKGGDFWTLFDTGARNTYVSRDVANSLVTSKAEKPIRTKLGGEVREIDQTTVLEASIDGHPISTHAFVVDEIGTDEDGKPIQVLFGALAMQQWGIRPIPDEERLDLSHYPTEFLEF